MASATASQALTKRSDDMALMPPPPPPKRIKRPTKVLDEDDYTDALSQIIARDFFPGLLETESKQEYLDALDSRDSQWIAAAEKRLTEVMTPGPDGRRMRGRRGTNLAKSSTIGEDTPKGWQGETPGSTISSSTTATNATESRKPKIDTNMSLTAFQERYTSEDNESFYKLLDKQNKKKSERYSWMWAANKIPSGRQIAHRKRQKLLAASKEADDTENDGKQLIRAEPADQRPAMPDTWQSQPDNSLMFLPQSIEDTHQSVMQRNEETSAAPPRAVVYDNTRLSNVSSSSDAEAAGVPPSPSLSAVRDAIGGNPRRSSNSSFAGASTPRVNGYAFVDDREPELSPPSTTSDITSSSSSTNALRLLASDNDSTPNPFKLSASTRREELHHRMVDKVARNNRIASAPSERKPTDDLRRSHLQRQQQQTPKFMSSPMMISTTTTTRTRKQGAGLTPAGEKLMGKMGMPMSTTGSASTSSITTPVGLWERGKTPKGKGGPSRLREGWTPKA